mmetsp:Transcript_17814/g.43836  ORF Transcript_17814/g.43836 Transcript_17814/m.43836 type:complete len:247 (-) Transcript_17814:938-1678(-)
MRSMVAATSRATERWRFLRDMRATAALPPRASPSAPLSSIALHFSSSANSSAFCRFTRSTSASSSSRCRATAVSRCCCSISSPCACASASLVATSCASCSPRSALRRATVDCVARMSRSWSWRTLASSFSSLRITPFSMSLSALCMAILANVNLRGLASRPSWRTTTSCVSPRSTLALRSCGNALSGAGASAYSGSRDTYAPSSANTLPRPLASSFSSSVTSTSMPVRRTATRWRSGRSRLSGAYV